ALSIWIVSDAVEHGFRFETIDWAQKSCEVNPPELPDRGEIRATRLLCHTLAKICPSTNSSSFS
ncbi:MAG TPA: hypothetical protein VFQ43_19195, partial [Nitrososphaera sp.]|nr:hypothetical protein [Nitrososphaera sp.]